jgi:hypothetical protein
MQLVATISIPNPHHEQKYVILPDELIRLRALKLINDRCYVYLALRMTYSHSNPSINIPKFAEQWSLSEVDCRAAIAALHKKGCLEPVHEQLELQLYSTTEALAIVEDAKQEAKDKKTATP